MTTVTPTPAALRAARESIGLTQTQAAESVGYTLRSWQRWEAGDPIPVAAWIAWETLHKAALARAARATKEPAPAETTEKPATTTMGATQVLRWNIKPKSP